MPPHRCSRTAALRYDDEAEITRTTKIAEAIRRTLRYPHLGGGSRSLRCNLVHLRFEQKRLAPADAAHVDVAADGAQALAETLNDQPKSAR